ncbi:MAG: 50S ribosomal protein L4 [Eubacteriales bacterium]|nr:50S ribosomal protein L4 [Clostridiales bacterium]MDY5836247.1 50S ribosomal protein L4 [Eubacteriales bacterium]
MAKLDLYSMTGERKGDIEVSDELFALEPNQDLLHRAVVMQLANKRQGTHKTKDRSEVRGGGRKPYRQKGTGRARQGSIRSPLKIGGGVTFGPLSRSYRKVMPKKMRRQALKSALSACAQGEKMLVLDELTLQEVKTKTMATLLNNLKLDKSTLVILDAKNKVVELSARNIPGVTVEYVNTINVYDLLKHDKVLMTEASIRKLEEVYA